MGANLRHGHVPGLTAHRFASQATPALGALLLLVILSGCAAAPRESASGAADSRGQATSDPYVAYREEWVEFMLDCMEDAGFDVVTNGDGGVGIDFIPIEQVERYNTTEASCRSAAPALPSLDEAMAKDLYHRQIRTVKCLQDHGVDTRQAPSEASWVEGLLAGEVVWTAYDGVVDAVEGDLQELLALCPQAGEGRR